MASHDMTPRHQNCAQVPFALLRLEAPPPAAIAFASTRCFLVACRREARDLACVSEKHILLLVEASEAADDHTPVREAYSQRHVQQCARWLHSHECGNDELQMGTAAQMRRLRRARLGRQAAVEAEGHTH